MKRTLLVRLLTVIILLTGGSLSARASYKYSIYAKNYGRYDAISPPPYTITYDKVSYALLLGFNIRTSKAWKPENRIFELVFSSMVFSNEFENKSRGGLIHVRSITFYDTEGIMDSYTFCMEPDISGNHRSNVTGSYTYNKDKKDNITIQCYDAPANYIKIEGNSNSKKQFKFRGMTVEFVIDPLIRLHISSNNILVGTTYATSISRDNGTSAPTYTSSNEKVATVDANGKVTGVGPGTCTITAHCAANDDFAAGSATTTVNVKSIDKMAICDLDDWNQFADYVNHGATEIKAELKHSVDFHDGTAAMVGNSTYPYSGTFEGYGHAMVLYYNTSNQYAAPFSFVKGATIKNLYLNGSINTSARFAGSLIGQVVAGGNTTTVSNCASAVAIYSSVNGDATHGGFVGLSNGALNITDCIFKGLIDGASTINCSGFVGWSKKRVVSIANCLLFATFKTDASGCATFCRNRLAALTNSYYLDAYGTAQGTQVTSDQLRSGEVTYLLQANRSAQVWGQHIDINDTTQNNAAPELSTETKEYVYKLQPAADPSAATLYANSKTPDWNVAVGSTKYATCYQSFAFKVPDGMTACTVGKLVDQTAVFGKKYTAGSIVPGETAVLLKTNAAQTYALTLQPDNAVAANEGATNFLRGSDVATTTTAAGTPAGYGTYYYKFSLGMSGTALANTPGFYWGAQNGAAFESAAHKAWLAYTFQYSAKQNNFISFEEDETSSISSVTGDSQEEVWYTLLGVRLSQRPTLPGIYILNGKKVTVR